MDQIFILASKNFNCPCAHLWLQSSHLYITIDILSLTDYLLAEWYLIPKVLIYLLFPYLWAALKISLLDFTCCHKTPVTSGSDKIIYNSFDYVSVLNQLKGDPLCRHGNILSSDFKKYRNCKFYYFSFTYLIFKLKLIINSICLCFFVIFKMKKLNIILLILPSLIFFFYSPLSLKTHCI